MNSPIRAGVVPLNVVACKKPGHWIIRAVSPFTNWKTLVKAVMYYTGSIDSDLEWTGYHYEGWPSYVVYGDGDMPRLDWPAGVYKYPFYGSERTELYGPAQQLQDYADQDPTREWTRTFS